MAELSGPGGPTSSNFREPVANPSQLLTTRLARLSLEDIARAIKKDDSEACKVRAGERRCSLSEWCALIQAAGLKFVDVSRFCVKREDYEFMRRMTARAMANEDIARQLTFEDPE